MSYETTIESIRIAIGIMRGKRQIVLELLESKFYRVPQKYLDLIGKADSNKLMSWAINILNAKVIEEVFSD